MTHKAVVFLATGFEEIEAIAPIDILRRAGVSVTVCGVGADSSKVATGTHGLKIQCDAVIRELNPDDYTLTYFPGGMPGSTNLAGDGEVLEFARRVAANGGWNCAICAAPLALDAAGLLENAEYTCYPGIQEHIGSGSFTGKYIQRSGRILTACGPGASVDFALEILRALDMSAIAGQLARAMQVKR
ncbi:MAG: DJ-1/PfpI family protein [Victivallales bacterium]|nr:DJ-1/PfpI family protein [Victivallales bacterium]